MGFRRAMRSLSTKRVLRYPTNEDMLAAYKESPVKYIKAGQGLLFLWQFYWPYFLEHSF